MEEVFLAKLVSSQKYAGRGSGGRQRRGGGWGEERATWTMSSATNPVRDASSKYSTCTKSSQLKKSTERLMHQRHPGNSQTAAQAECDEDARTYSEGERMDGWKAQNAVCQRKDIRTDLEKLLLIPKRRALIRVELVRLSACKARQQNTYPQNHPSSSSHHPHTTTLIVTWR
eukprot:3616211-Rhodomonas_salina.2